MATIVNCPVCGKQQSSEVKVCLHCKIFISSEEKCVSCGKNVPYKEVFQPDPDRQSSCYHIRCIEAILAEVICPLCKHPFTFEEQKTFIHHNGQYGTSLYGSCHHCGHRQTLTNCKGCSLVITSENPLQVGSWTDHSGDVGPTQIKIYRHSYCDKIAQQKNAEKKMEAARLKQLEEAEKQRQQAIDKKRRLEKRCTACGKPLGTIDRIAFRLYHKDCFSSLPNYDE